MESLCERSFLEDVLSNINNDLRERTNKASRRGGDSPI